MQNYKPRVIYASSIAVFGTPFPEPIPDEFHLTPLTSYGTQKAVGEFLLNDYTRRGFFDGIGLRLPTICVRPGKPNKAASGFFSNIIREPLKGEEAVLPVAESVRHWHASPRAAVGFFLHAAEMDLAHDRPAPLPHHAGRRGDGRRADRGARARWPATRRRSSSAASPTRSMQTIVAGWPTAFEAKRSRELGFKADDSFEAIVRAHIEDEHGGRAPVMS